MILGRTSNVRSPVPDEPTEIAASTQTDNRDKFTHTSQPRAVPSRSRRATVTGPRWDGGVVFIMAWNRHETGRTPVFKQCPFVANQPVRRDNILGTFWRPTRRHDSRSSSGGAAATACCQFATGRAAKSDQSPQVHTSWKSVSPRRLQTGGTFLSQRDNFHLVRGPQKNCRPARGGPVSVCARFPC